MENLDDSMLLAELKRRMEESRIAVANLRTVTKNLEAVNEKLRQSEALKSDFLSNIRNEINNPLSAILGLSRRILDGKVSGEAAREAAGTVYHEAFDLDFQLRNIFAAAELEAGEAQPTAARVDVAALIRSQVKAFAHRAEDKGVTIEMDCRDCDAAGALVFTTDPDKLQKIVANLLANAIEYNLEGKRVTIRAWREGTGLLVSIADEGLGISEKDRKRVFDRFTQLDSGVRKRHHGHGLGLSIAKAMAEMLGGTVTLASEQGKGCIFTVNIAAMVTDRPVDVTSADGNEFIFDEGTQF